MKSIFFCITLFLSALSSAFSHGGIDLGPNGGRLLKFRDEGLTFGEVTVKDGRFHMRLLDKDKKPIEIKEQLLSATAGTREAPKKLDVSNTKDHFEIPVVPEGQWVIFQFREKQGAVAITTRMHYETTICSACKEPEWICACDAKK